MLLLADDMAAAAYVLATPLRDTITTAVGRLDEVLSSERNKATTVTSVGTSMGDLVDTLLSGRPREDLVSTGLTTLDDMIGGWRRKELAILAGRPGMGKSAIALSAALRTARAGDAVLFYSMEMTREALAARALSDLSWQPDESIPYELALGRKSLNSRQMDIWGRAAAHWATLPVMIDEQRGLTTAEVCARSRRQADILARAGRRMSLIVVDHLHLVVPTARYGGQKVHEVTEISNGLATLAKDLDVALLALVQLNRAVEGRDNKRPQLSDLRDSGTLEQDGATICFAYREHYYLERLTCDPGSSQETDRLADLDACRNTLELMVAKNRHGRIGMLPLFCDIGCNAIRDMAKAGSATV